MLIEPISDITMRFHKIKVYVGGCTLMSFCLLVYKMTSELPPSPNLAFRKSPIMGNNGSFLPPHVMMRTGHSQFGEVLEEIDGHIPGKVTSKVHSLVHYLDLQKDTSEIIPSNSTKITVRMNPLKVIPQPPKKLPLCASTFTPNPNYPILDTLRNCDQTVLTFEADLEVWLYKEDVMCEGRVHIYDKQAVLLRDAVIDRTMWNCEDSDENLPAKDRRCIPERGGFKIFCDDNNQPTKFFKGSVQNYLQNWLELTVACKGKVMQVNEMETRFTIAVQRHDHKSLYHTMAELYNVFLVLKFYDESPENVKVLLVDTHKNGISDLIWPKVFPHTDRIVNLDPLTFYQRMFWSPYSQQSAFLMHNEGRLAYVEQFRDFILKQYGVPLSTRLSCRRLRVTLICDRNHEGSKEEQKQMQNEREILKVIKDMHSSFIVEKVHMENFDMRDQLELAVNTDILIGLHGASLTHALFLPTHGGLVEFVPSYGQRHNSHFEALAKWRNLAYIRWENRDVVQDGRSSQVTVVPAFIVRDRIRKMYTKLCPSVKLHL